MEIQTFPRGEKPENRVQRRQVRFLAAYGETGMITRAARWAKCSIWAHYDWMKSDPSYPQRFKEAGDKFTQRVEDTLHLVGVHGVERPILYKGKQVYIEGRPLFENRRAEQVLLRIAEARMPEKYKPRVEQTNLLDLDPAKIPAELLDKIANRMIEQALGSAAAVDEVDRRLAAGEPVALEDVAKAIEAPENPGQ